MSKGKYANRAAHRQQSQDEAIIEGLRGELAHKDEVIAELQKANRRIAPLETALAQAHDQIEEVTSPEIERLEKRLDKALAEVGEIDRNQPHRERIFTVARDLLVKYEGMTEWEAMEAVTQSETDTVMIENDAQRKLPTKVTKAIQRARGLRT